MSTINIGWLKDNNGNKFAPKTLSSQIITNEGNLFEDEITAKLENISVISSASDVIYDNTVTQLNVNNAQDAIDKLNEKIDVNNFSLDNKLNNHADDTNIHITTEEKNTLNNNLSSHIDNINIHVTEEEKNAWNNIDAKMTEIPTSNNADYPLLLASAGQSEETSSNIAYFNSGITVNPNTKTINADSISCCGYKIEKVTKLPTYPSTSTIYIVVDA